MSFVFTTTSDFIKKGLLLYAGLGTGYMLFGFLQRDKKCD